MFAYQAAFIRTSQGVYDEELFHVQLTTVLAVLASAGGRVWWEERRTISDPEFVAVLERSASRV